VVVRCAGFLPRLMNVGYQPLYESHAPEVSNAFHEPGISCGVDHCVGSERLLLVDQNHAAPRVPVPFGPSAGSFAEVHTKISRYCWVSST
jgi:hypothetical protein